MALSSLPDPLIVPSSRQEVRIQQTTLLSVASGFRRSGCPIASKSAARTEDPLSANSRGRSPSDPPPLPRCGGIRRGHRAEAMSKRMGDQHPQRTAGDRRVRPSKKLYQCRPKADLKIETQRTKKRTRTEHCDPLSMERGVRQLLADKNFRQHGRPMAPHPRTLAAGNLGFALWLERAIGRARRASTGPAIDP